VLQVLFIPPVWISAIIELPGTKIENTDQVTAGIGFIVFRSCSQQTYEPPKKGHSAYQEKTKISNDHSYKYSMRGDSHVHTIEFLPDILMLSEMQQCSEYFVLKNFPVNITCCRKNSTLVGKSFLSTWVTNANILRWIMRYLLSEVCNSQVP